MSWHTTGSSDRSGWPARISAVIVIFKCSARNLLVGADKTCQRLPAQESANVAAAVEAAQQTYVHSLCSGLLCTVAYLLVSCKVRQGDVNSQPCMREVIHLLCLCTELTLYSWPVASSVHLRASKKCWSCVIAGWKQRCCAGKHSCLHLLSMAVGSPSCLTAGQFASARMSCMPDNVAECPHG